MTEQATADETTGRLRQLAEKHYARGVEIRHHLHPELSGQETKTARYIAEILRECGIETQTGIGRNGVLGVIRGGKPGKPVLLVAAMALSELWDEISGTVKLVFQPVEESGVGAKPMLDAGILENPRVDAAFGCHLAGDVPEG